MQEFTKPVMNPPKQSWSGTFFPAWIGMTVGIAIPLFFVIFIGGTWDVAKSMTIPIAAAIGFIVALCWTPLALAKNEVKENRHRAIKELMCRENIIPDRVFDTESTFFALDTKLGKAFYCGEKLDNHAILSHSDIVEVSMEVNKDTISKMSSGTSRSLAGAATGAVLLGGVGAIVGAIASKNPNIHQASGLSSVKIKLAVRKSSSNLIELSFLDVASPISAMDMLARQRMDDANHWWACLKVFMHSSKEAHLPTAQA